MVIIDHLASIVTLFGFPLVVFGLFDLYRERKLSMWKARKWVGIALLLLGVAAWSADVADRLGYIKLASWSGFPSGTGRIVWNLEEAASGRGYFLNMQKLTDQEPRIVGFGAHGKNNSSEPITDFDAYLRSDKTNETLPIYILAPENVANACTMAVPTLPKDTLGIPAFADFDIVSHGKPFFVKFVYADAMPLTKFLNEFVPFTIVMKYDGKEYKRHYSKWEVDRQVTLLEKISAPFTVPRVVRKQGAPIAIPPLLATPIPHADVTGKIPAEPNQK